MSVSPPYQFGLKLNLFGEKATHPSTSPVYNTKKSGRSLLEI